MGVRQLKVRPRKADATRPCAIELATMLGCWASMHDITGSAACRDVTQALHDCMRRAGGRKKVPRPTINYHLARLGKDL